ncbi:MULTISPECIES: hypothetical protein [unclassified Microcoleus]|uniref:hypothetical protein n=1 Tax=unclassified Microcoleus TaxID=2642155 RepID=UPI002FD1F1BB
MLNSDKVSLGELLECLESLCKEYGYVQGMTITNFRDLVSGKKALAEIQDLIEKVKQKLKSLKCTN